jgi:hypothetical protein
MTVADIHGRDPEPGDDLDAVVTDILRGAR